MNWHRLLLPIFMLSILLINIKHAEAKEIGLYINDRPISSNGPAPFIQNGTTMVPLRTVGESFQMRVDWEAETRSIQLVNEKINIKLIIDEPRAEVNGKIVELPQAPAIIANRAFVPLRFIGEQLNKDVEWEPEQHNIFIMDDRQASDQYWLAKLVEAEALNGNDPTKGALYFYNPVKTNNRFLAGRSSTGMIGNHRFTR